MYLKINQIFVCLRGMWENKKKNSIYQPLFTIYYSICVILGEKPTIDYFYYLSINTFTFVIKIDVKIFFFLSQNKINILKAVLL